MIPTKIRSHNTWTFGPTRKKHTINETKQGCTMHTPSPLEQGLSTHALYAATICYNEQTGKLYTDLTG